MRQRLQYLDMAKGLGMLAVILFHSKGLWLFRDWVVAFFMPLFFVVSGCLYAMSRRPDATAERVRKLAGAYVWYNACCVAIAAIYGFVRQEGTLWGYLHAFAQSLYGRESFLRPLPEQGTSFFSANNGQLWFLAAMATATALYGLVRKFDDGSAGYRVGVSAGLFGAAALFSKLPWLLPWSLDVMPLLAWFLWLGSWCAQTALFAQTSRRLAGMCMGLALLFSCCRLPQLHLGIGQYDPNGVKGVLLCAVAGACGSVLCVAFCALVQRMEWLRRPLAFVGRHTLPILAFHMWAVMAWRAGMGHLAGVVGTRLAAMIDNPVCSVLFCIFASLLADALFTGGKNRLLAALHTQEQAPATQEIANP